MTSPAWSAVVITGSNVGPEVTVSYSFVGEPNSVRAFALDIVVDTAVITDVNDDVNPDYNIYPGSIVIAGGEVTEDGNAVADPCDYPADTQPGVGSIGVTVEMGALYSPPNDGNGPPSAGDLLKFTVDADCNVSITLNEARGGVVLTDPTQDPTSFTAPGTDPTPPYLVEIDTGPECWNFLGQCHGDSDDTLDVKAPDFIALKNAWYKVYPHVDYNPCADFDRNGDVKAPDFITLKNNWYKPVPPNCPTGGTWPP
jgi:hypothetical protein